ncbi:MAG: MCE family protein [Methylomonas sp.]|nr:MCE family protein [Methylomonas sp.]
MGKDSYALATGLFMAVLIGASILIVIWLGEFEHHTQRYVAVSRDAVTGLKAGSTVYYRGIAVGKVDSVAFDSQNPDLILVPMTLEENVRLKRSVVATLEMQGVTGLTRIALSDGDQEAPGWLPAGDDPAYRIPIKPSLVERLSVSGEATVAQAEALMLRLNRLLDDDNIRHIGGILAQAEMAGQRFNDLQTQASSLLAAAPALIADSQKTLREFTDLSREMRGDLARLSRQSGQLLDTGQQIGQQLRQTTLPQTEHLLQQLQLTLRRFDRVATQVETDPQAFLLGRQALQAAPGEPGFEEAP